MTRDLIKELKILINQMLVNLDKFESKLYDESDLINFGIYCASSPDSSKTFEQLFNDWKSIKN